MSFDWLMKVRGRKQIASLHQRREAALMLRDKTCCYWPALGQNVVKPSDFTLPFGIFEERKSDFKQNQSKIIVRALR